METKALTEQEKANLNNFKQLHDVYVTSLQHYTTGKMTFIPEEFEGVVQIIGVLKSHIEQIKKEIYKLEPPKEEEKPKAYAMDLTHIKADAKPTLEVVQ